MSTLLLGNLNLKIKCSLITIFYKIRLRRIDFYIETNRIFYKGENTMNDTVFLDFFYNGEHFTVEDYSNNSKAVYHEERFVEEIKGGDHNAVKSNALDAARKYLSFGKNYSKNWCR